MAILMYKDDINKDTQVFGYNTYIGGGQGCGTIWYKNVSTARKALKHDGKPKRGEDFNLCKACRCAYSIFDPNYNKFQDFVCNNLKKAYAESFERGGK